MENVTLPSTLPAAFPTRQAAAIEGRSRRGAVTGKLKTALDLMVWDNLRRPAAAKKAGLADSSLRFAFRKPHVMAYYHAELTALRNNVRAHNVHRLDKIADESKNDMAKVGAIKALKQIADQADERGNGRGAAILPGLQIVIMQSPGSTLPPRVFGPAPFPPPAIDHQPAQAEPARLLPELLPN